MLGWQLVPQLPVASRRVPPALRRVQFSRVGEAAVGGAACIASALCCGNDRARKRHSAHARERERQQRAVERPHGRTSAAGAAGGAPPGSVAGCGPPEFGCKRGRQHNLRHQAPVWHLKIPRVHSQKGVSPLQAIRLYSAIDMMEEGAPVALRRPRRRSPGWWRRAAARPVVVRRRRVALRTGSTSVAQLLGLLLVWSRRMVYRPARKLAALLPGSDRASSAGRSRPPPWAVGGAHSACSTHNRRSQCRREGRRQRVGETQCRTGSQDIGQRRWGRPPAGSCGGGRRPAAAAAAAAAAGGQGNGGSYLALDGRLGQESNGGLNQLGPRGLCHSSVSGGCTSSTHSCSAPADLSRLDGVVTWAGHGGRQRHSACDIMRETSSRRFGWGKFIASVYTRHTVSVSGLFRNTDQTLTTPASLAPPIKLEGWHSISEGVLRALHIPPVPRWVF